MPVVKKTSFLKDAMRFLLVLLVVERVLSMTSTDSAPEGSSKSQALVVFSNANPYAQAFSLAVRPFVIGVLPPPRSHADRV